MATTTATRGIYSKTPERRAEILDAALEVFADAGFRSGSLREIADKAGMSQAGLLHHFGSKKRLLAAVLEHRDEINMGFFDLNSRDGLAYMRGLLRLVAHNCSVPGLVEVYCQLSAEATSADHPAHDYFAARYVRIRKIMADSLRDVDAKGFLREGSDPDEVARDVLALSDGLQVQWLFAGKSFDMTRVLRRYLAEHITVEL